MDAFNHIDDWPATKIGVGCINKSGLELTSGDAFEVFELASVTKALFSLAVLVAIEEGTLDANAPAGPEGSTIANLLSHSSGLSMRASGNGKAAITQPGKKRIYSNQAFDILADELAKHSEMSAADYFDEAVAQPLGMKKTQIYGSVAFQGRSCVSDLLTFCGELLNPTLISAQTLRKATLAHLPALDGILPGFGKQTPNQWGFGFEIKGTKSDHWTAPDNSPGTFGHFGQAGTFLWVDPLAEIACVALTNKDFGPWAKSVWPVFSQAVLDEFA